MVANCLRGISTNASVCALLAAISMLGCRPAVPPQLTASAEAQALDPKLQTRVQEVLTETCGTPTTPKLLGAEGVDSARLQRGAVVYAERCAACHGVTGDGAGEAAEYLYPRPRDYRRGIFKFTSTPYGAKPTRDDLIRTIRRGAKGTSMPSFALLPDEDIEAVVDYVLALTHRGELETLLVLEADSEDEIAPERVPELADEIVAQWKGAREDLVVPMTKMPLFSPESVELGKKAFLTEEAGCFKCHGADGRAEITGNVDEFKDAWGYKTKAADLTSGMYHGGDRPIDIYRRIYSGINGTPMPSFKEKLAEQPDTFWHLVHYVQHISGARRRTLNEAAASAGPTDGQAK